jgi:hypothetical protein
MECEFCNKSFTKKYNLEYHQKTAKYCQMIQVLKRENTLMKNDLVVTHVEMKSLRDENTILSEELDQLRKSNIRLEIEKDILSSNNKHKKDFLTLLARFDMNDPKYICILDEAIEQRLNRITLKLGSKFMPVILCENVLIDEETGKPRYIVSDTSRYTGLFVTPDDIIVRDSLMKQLIKWSKPSFEVAAKKIIDINSINMLDYNNDYTDEYKGYRSIKFVDDDSKVFRKRMLDKATTI